MAWHFALLAQAAADQSFNDMLTLPVKMLIAVAILVGSFASGVFLSRSLRMPDHSWKIGLVLFALLTGVAVTVLGWPPKLGIDLSGGVILVYEVDQEKKADAGTTLKMEEMVAAVARRINPGGTKEITIRPYGAEQIEIVIPAIDDDEVKRIEKIITNIGSLEFRIVANRTDHASDIERALELPLTEHELKGPEGKTTYRWVEVEHKPKTIAQFTGAEFAQRKDENGNLEVLAKLDRFNVTGGELTQAQPSERNGRPCVEFGFTALGANKFGGLTGANLPDAATGHERQLGIILDDFLISAPSIKSVITDRGEITGEFTEQEVNDLVSVLRAGKLPAALEKTPSTRLKTGPTLGRDTIEQAKIATMAAMCVVVAFMVIYYRFAGVVASFALIINLLLTLAAMIAIKAAFTLTGVAGLALTLGMAVDANVLIYERLREELQRGATLRMAIRNGFARAMTTIIDSNLTTLITAVVLYIVGTDQIKGFAVTLTLGLLISLFTSIFVSRVILDICEKQRWITHLHMMQFVGVTNVDFIGKWRICAAVSAVLMAIGIGAMVHRGSNLFDIDFLGGTSVQLLFQEEQAIADVREKLQNVPVEIQREARAELETTLKPDLLAEARKQLGEGATESQVAEHVEARLDELSNLRDVAVSGVQLPGEVEGLRFNFNTSNPSTTAVETLVKDLFQGKLAHNSMTYEPLVMVSAADADKRSAAEAATPSTDANSPPANGTIPAAPAKPSENEGAARGASDDRLLALADTATELALLAQNADAAATQPATPAQDAAAAEVPPAAAAEQQVAKIAEQQVAKIAEQQVAKIAEQQVAKTKVTFGEKVNYDTVEAKLKNAMDKLELNLPFKIANADYSPGSRVPFETWHVDITGTKDEAEQVLKAIQQDLVATPVFPSSSNIGGKVAGNTRSQAILALLASLVLIVAYIWVRFERAVFGLAAVVALVHDTVISVGAVAISYYIATPLSFLQVDQFKIDLNIVAAVLTIIGYSLNDTIVVFDRIREVRGKSPYITKDMLNLSINQTLSRTILTGLTTMFVLVILYFWGGQGIHGFAYCLLVGMIVGTFSSIYVASPILLWLMNPSRKREQALAGTSGRGPNYSKSMQEREKA